MGSDCCKTKTRGTLLFLHKIRLVEVVPVCCFVVYSMRRFVSSRPCDLFVLVFFSPFNIAITSLGKKRANLSAFRTFVRFGLVWFYRFPLGVWKGLRFVIVALRGVLSFFFFFFC